MQNTSPENKLRLLMIYASVYPEKFEGDKASMLMQVTNITSKWNTDAGEWFFPFNLICFFN